MREGLNRAVFEGLPEAALVIVDERVVLANTAAKVFFDATGDSLIDRPLDDLLGPEGKEQLLRHLEVHQPGTICSCITDLFIRAPGEAGTVRAGCRATKLPLDGASPEGAVILLLREVIDVSRAEELIAGLAGLVRSDSSSSGMLGVISAAAPMFASLGWWASLFQTSEAGVEVVHLLAPPVEEHPLVEFARRIRGLGSLPWTWFPVVRRVYDSGETLYMTDAPNRVGVLSGLGPEFAEKLRDGGFSRAVWVPIRPGGVTTHILLVVGPDLTEHDVGAMELFGAQMAAAVRMEDLHKELVRRERLAAVGEMAGVLAHEVRNPLAVIFNAVAGLRRSIGPAADRDGLLGIIHEEADRLKRVVSALLDFARPSVPEIRPMTIDDLVEEAISVSRSHSEAGKIEIEVDLPKDLPLVDSDPHLLMRVLVNVLDNAFQAVSNEGTIRVSAKPDDEKWLRVCVFNDGEPLPEEMSRKAFLPFFTTRATGTGLGLSVVKRTIEDLGARVALESEGAGASLSIWLPVSSGALSNPEEIV